MVRTLLVSILLLPAVALAQPAPPPPGPGYAPPPAYAVQTPFMYHQGVTVELNLGVGFMWSRDNSTGMESQTYTSLGGLDIGIGGWVSPQIAVSGRIAGVTYSEDIGNGNTLSLTGAFFGPSVQYWVDDHLWFGGGIGLAVARVLSSSDSTIDTSSASQTGFGIDLRAGYTFTSSSKNSFNISVELTPGIFSTTDAMGNSSTGTLNGFAILAGYQYL
jgi:hypothetical protein